MSVRAHRVEHTMKYVLVLNDRFRRDRVFFCLCFRARLLFMVFFIFIFWFLRKTHTSTVAATRLVGSRERTEPAEGLEWSD